MLRDEMKKLGHMDPVILGVLIDVCNIKKER